ncbi:MAG: endonuclease/exonuclease/phosphatase family protein [Proteobacteria bacterium]|nr:endonuclease/exonuclease/phosphatase family protein [Pseudomonadota bacterium]
MRIITLNLAHGRGRGRHQAFRSRRSLARQLDHVIEVLREQKPDVLALQEVDRRSRWTFGVNQLDVLRDALEMPHASAFMHQSWVLGEAGTALLSTAPLLDVRCKGFAESWRDNKGYVSAKTHGVTVVSAHTDFANRSVRERQMRALVRQLEGPTVVAGDLNDQVSAVSRWFEGTGFHTEAEAAPTFRKLGPRRLDWVLASEHLRFALYETLAGDLSDHQAVLAEIVPAK